MPTSDLPNRDYTVGWICALALEMVAAKAMLDVSHGRPKEQHPSDQNNYSLGRIGDHNVVIACLPAGVYGTTSAARVAADMQSSFESIRFGLMVGIGGGVPSKEFDIRLGDVVVSKPGRTSGGVLQYDFGKTVEDGRFMRIGSLNKPPQVLLTAISSLEAGHMMEESRISEFLSEMWAKYRKLQVDFKYQGESNDRLYQADYDHVSDENTCESCDRTKLIRRPDREHCEPVVHYGIIASGNQVMKHGITRDRLKADLDILCFEMEAAGLMDDFPCLVIRGICDYADSHKNKCWQKYAAATAAAYAKELLGTIPASQVVATPTVAEAMVEGKPVCSALTVVD
jgi:nucleoside phosphorylase